MSTPLVIQVKDLTTSLKIMEEQNVKQAEELEALKQTFDAEKVEAASKIEDLEKEIEQAKQTLAEKEKELEAMKDEEPEAEEKAEEVVEEKAEEMEVEEPKSESNSELLALQSELNTIKAALKTHGVMVHQSEGKPEDHGGVQENTITPEAFEVLSPMDKNNFFRNGGKIAK